MSLEVLDQKLKDKIADKKQEKRHEEILGLIAAFGEQLTEDIKQAISEVVIEVPEVVIPDITIPEITIPDITIPDITVPKVRTEGIEKAIKDGLASFQAPVVNVEAPIVNIPDFPTIPTPEVHVEAPIIHVPETKFEHQIPIHDQARKVVLLDENADQWTLSREGVDICIYTIFYDKDDNVIRYEIKPC